MSKTFPLSTALANVRTIHEQIRNSGTAKNRSFNAIYQLNLHKGKYYSFYNINILLTLELSVTFYMCTI